VPIERNARIQGRNQLFEAARLAGSSSSKFRIPLARNSRQRYGGRVRAPWRSRDLRSGESAINVAQGSIEKSIVIDRHRHRGFIVPLRGLSSDIISLHGITTLTTYV
jgi:hypothetical protein